MRRCLLARACCTPGFKTETNRDALGVIDQDLYTARIISNVRESTRDMKYNRHRPAVCCRLANMGFLSFPTSLLHQMHCEDISRLSSSCVQVAESKSVERSG